MKKKMPDAVLAIIQRCEKSNLPKVEKKKYAINKSTTIQDIFNILRKKINLNKDEAFFLFIRDGSSQKICNLQDNIYDLYQKYRD
jgi:GABA(A) receptor-associated protein